MIFFGTLSLRSRKPRGAVFAEPPERKEHRMIEWDKQPVEADVLVAGGGIGGLMAAISAAEKGVRVVVAEKANTMRSGSGATGNDHFLCYISEIHGADMNFCIRVAQDSVLGKFNDTSLVVRLFEQAFDRVQDWERWGIPMKPTGKWEFTGHAFPERPRLWLKYAGSEQKKILTNEARKRGVRIENHLVITEAITRDGELIGAVGISTREEKPAVKIFRAKSLVLATGCATRLYPPISPGMLFNIAPCPSNAGGGRAMAYRAGATLVNMEIPNRHAGPKYFSRYGKATWIGVFTDPAGKPIGPFVQKPTKELGDITADIWNSVFSDMSKSGKGPVYMDCTSTTEEDLAYMMWGLEHEGLTSMLDYMKEEGIDLRKHWVEFTRYEPFLTGRGIEINLQAETTIPGLYAVGDEVGNLRASISGAATYGWIAGKSAADRAKRIGEFQKAEENPLFPERIRFYSSILQRESGPTWQEANWALQQIMNDYAGDIRTETLMRAGLKYLRDLKEKVRTELTANNSHTLIRGLETIDLIECGEAIFLTALERKETCPPHVRLDFPFTNPLLQDRCLTICKQNDQPMIQWRDRR